MSREAKRERKYWAERDSRNGDALFCFEIVMRRGKTVVKRFTTAEISVFLRESLVDEKPETKEVISQ